MLIKIESFIYKFIYDNIYMRFVGFNLDEELLEKLKIISFVTKKNRTELVKEGLDYIINKYADSFDEFQKHIDTIRKR